MVNFPNENWHFKFFDRQSVKLLPDFCYPVVVACMNSAIGQAVTFLYLQDIDGRLPSAIR